MCTTTPPWHATTTVSPAWRSTNDSSAPAMRSPISSQVSQPGARFVVLVHSDSTG